MLPGDLVEAVPRQAVTGEAVAALRQILGPGKPVRFHYFEGVEGAVQGDFGASHSGCEASGVDRSRLVMDFVAPGRGRPQRIVTDTAMSPCPVQIILDETNTALDPGDPVAAPDVALQDVLA